MDARSKLNAAHVNGALIVAGIVGGLAGSWPVFGVTFGLLVTSALIAGGIRPSRRQH
jgi:hypothetical protein